MATDFSTLPVISLAPLKADGGPSEDDLNTLAARFHDTFATTGFAYLIDYPLSFDDEDVFDLAARFFVLPESEKMKLAKKSFCKEHDNTYRGYFPTQPDMSPDNLKEGFEIGPPTTAQPKDDDDKNDKINLSEPNVWPSEDVFPARPKLEQLYDELQSLASTILSLLARALGKPADFFASYLTDSLSTLRLLHYPSVGGSLSDDIRDAATGEPKLSCSPHTDSGILTLLHQDPTGGLEVRNATGNWVKAPYIRNSIVVNIGDLMAEVSGGRFVATMHRVRAPRPPKTGTNGGTNGTVGMGRFSVPFFFEPGERCVIKGVNADAEGGTDGLGKDGIVYGPHVRAKMKTWVEFQDQDDQ